MKNKLITLVLAILLLSIKQLSAQVVSKRNIPAKDSIKVIDTMLAFKPIKANNDSIPNDTQIRICVPSRGKIVTPPPLFVLKNNNRILKKDDDKLISPMSIANIEIPVDASYCKKYGAMAANGVIIITLKEDSVFLSVEKIVSVYNLPRKCTKYPVYIDEKYCAKDAIMLERSKTKSVRVIDRLMSGINEKQLEITTVDKAKVLTNN